MRLLDTVSWREGEAPSLGQLRCLPGPEVPWTKGAPLQCQNLGLLQSAFLLLCPVHRLPGVPLAPLSLACHCLSEPGGSDTC